MGPDIADELNELLSEAAIEISNLDCRENVVYRRLRAMQARLMAASDVGSIRKFSPSETSLPADSARSGQQRSG